MRIGKDYSKKIFNIDDPQKFHDAAIELFQFQYSNNSLYKRFVDLLGKDPDLIKDISDIPFLPVELFRDHQVVTGIFDEGLVFRSSSTTASKPSVHFVKDPNLYKESFLTCFQQFFGEPSQYHILALLPGYLERSDSSLVYMAEELILQSKPGHSGFFLDDLEKLDRTLSALNDTNEPVMLIGVSFALLDFVEQYPQRFSTLKLIETGGMKGRRREPVRHELHNDLKKGFGVKEICSEYGMTELLSQAWSLSSGKFHSPPWMKVLVRDINDPFHYVDAGKTGGINIIDLANIHSCSFLSTQDLGRLNVDGSFEVLGRFDNSDLRGCNLMVS